MALSLLTFDFRHTPLRLRERLAWSTRTLPAALERLRAAHAGEAAILSTCNRVEIVASLAEGQRASSLRAFLCDWHAVAPEELEGHGRLLEGEAAARHLIRVACGLESLVPGEMQILGQVKGALRIARESGALGPELESLFAVALQAGRRARRETTIARGPVSIAHAAVELARRHFGGTLEGRRVLLLGSGKMGESTAHQLHAVGAEHVIVANRTFERACELARRWGGSARSMEMLPESLAEADAVIAATAAPHLLLYPEHLATLGGRPVLLVDLAVPRDIDPAVGALPGVTLCDVDGLQAVVRESLALRNGARARVEQLVDEALDRYRADRAARGVAPTIVELRASAEEIRCRELERALGQLGDLDERERAVVEALTRRLINKLLHQPTVTLRARAATGQGDEVAALIHDLFALSERES